MDLQRPQVDDGLSQEENVPLLKWVAFAVMRSLRRFFLGTLAMTMSASVSELLWLASSRVGLPSFPRWSSPSTMMLPKKRVKTNRKSNRISR